MMIAQCIRNSGASLGEPARDHFYTPRTIYHLTVGAEYPVLGMGVFETTLLVLVQEDTGYPQWLPIGLFNINDEVLPSDWKFTLRDGIAASGGEASNRWVALWGFAELVQDHTYSDRLIEGDPAALAVFHSELEKMRGRGDRCG